MKFLKLSLASLLASTALFAGTYNVDVSHSDIGFKIKHMMISNVKGSFDTFSGVIEYDEATKTFKAITGKIETNSINTANEKRDTHLKSADFFDAVQYPEITFVLKKVEENSAYGELSIRGIKKVVKLELENNGIAKDPWGNQRMGLSLKGEINRKDFGLNWNKALETGGVLVGETVKLEIELEAILAK
jgi:polyisoprenoid-binding protein YceI